MLVLVDKRPGDRMVIVVTVLDTSHHLTDDVIRWTHLEICYQATYRAVSSCKLLAVTQGLVDWQLPIKHLHDSSSLMMPCAVQSVLTVQNWAKSGTKWGKIAIDIVGSTLLYRDLAPWRCHLLSICDLTRHWYTLTHDSPLMMDCCRMCLFTLVTVILQL